MRWPGENSLREAFGTLVRLHTERWQHAGEAGVLADPLVLAWHREVLPLLQASGLLLLLVLRRESEILAVLYALVDPSPVPNQPPGEAFYLIGQAAQYAGIHPGTLLTALSIEHAAGGGITTTDMLRGNETYKKCWHAQPLPTYSFALPRQSLP